MRVAAGAALAFGVAHLVGSVKPALGQLGPAPSNGAAEEGPTAGEIPIVQTLMSFGLGAGGASVLLITLPPVSLPSLVMLSRVVPAKALALVALSVVVLGLLAGGAAQLLGF